VIDNILRLEQLWASESLVPEMEDRRGVEVYGEPHPLRFDAEGWLIIPEGDA
jgi:hypothetical protein